MKHLHPLLLVLLFSSGCAYKTYSAVDANFRVTKVEAKDLEEDGYLFSSGSDEIKIQYSLLALDENGNKADYRYRKYGPITFSRRGDRVTNLASVGVRVPPKGQLVIAGVIIEDDDYSSISQAIDDVSFLVDVAEYGAKFARAPKRVLRGIKTFSRRLNWAGLAISVIDFVDTDDVLMSRCLVIDADQLQEIGSKEIRQAFRGIGSNYGDRYDYEMTYALSLRADPTQTVTQRIKKARSSPSFMLSFSPFMARQDINNYWLRQPDKLLVPDPNDDDRYLWSDGLTNNQWAAQASILLSPAFSKKGEVSSRFFLDLGYAKSNWYGDNAKESFFFDIPTYFNGTTAPPGATFTVDSIGLATTELSGGITYRIITPGLLIGIGGGATQTRGKTTFTNPTVTGNIRFDYNQNNEVIEKQIRPYASLALGFGRIGRKAGLVFNISSQLYFSDLRFNDNFQIYTTANQDRRISLEREKATDLRVNFGLSFLF